MINVIILYDFKIIKTLRIFKIEKIIEKKMYFRYE